MTEKLQLPEAFAGKMQRLLAEEWQQFLYCYENDKYQALRFNPLKKGWTAECGERILSVLTEAAAADCKETDSGGTDREERSCGRVPWAEQGFYYDSSMRPGKHPYHEIGLYYIQEPSAMSAAAMLAPKPGMRVLDLCAAPGGKTTQLASYLGQQGLLVANEIHPARAKILSQNVERMGITNAIVTNEDSRKLAERFPGYFHAILVDAPCSGEGMFRKNPDAMEEWSPAQVELCAARQREILENAAEMLLPGGTLVYSTCTFSPEENEQTIVHFLREHAEFSLEERSAPWFDAGVPKWGNEPENPDLAKTFRLWPHHLHGEGHFVAVVKKAGTLPEVEAGGGGAKPIGKEGTPKRIACEESAEKRNASPKTEKKQKRTAVKAACKNNLDKEKQKALDEFLESTLTQETADWIWRGELTLFGDQLYRLPEQTPSLQGLRVLRAGLHIGEFKKNRLEPSHALALALGQKDVRSVWNLELPDARVYAFFNGESLPMEESRKGWTLVCIDGFSAGWGKAAGYQLKNHYPKGLRREVR